MQTEEKTIHYVCPGQCRGTSENLPDTCGSDTCSKKGAEFVACNCEDGEHVEVKKSEYGN